MQQIKLIIIHRIFLIKRGIMIELAIKELTILTTQFLNKNHVGQDSEKGDLIKN